MPGPRLVIPRVYPDYKDRYSSLQKPQLLPDTWRHQPHSRPPSYTCEQDEPASKTKEPKTLRGTFRKFAETTSLQGVPYINRASKPHSKAIWAVIFLAAIGATIFQLYLIIDQYLKFETTTTITLAYKRLEFPSVTVCNFNPVRKSKISKGTSQLKTFVEAVEPTDKIDDEYKNVKNPDTAAPLPPATGQPTYICNCGICACGKSTDQQAAFTQPPFSPYNPWSSAAQTLPHTSDVVQKTTTPIRQPSRPVAPTKQTPKQTTDPKRTTIKTTTPVHPKTRPSYLTLRKSLTTRIQTPAVTTSKPNIPFVTQISRNLIYTSKTFATNPLKLPPTDPYLIDKVTRTTDTLTQVNATTPRAPKPTPPYIRTPPSVIPNLIPTPLNPLIQPKPKQPFSPKPSPQPIPPVGPPSHKATTQTPGPARPIASKPAPQIIETSPGLKLMKPTHKPDPKPTLRGAQANPNPKQPRTKPKPQNPKIPPGLIPIRADAARAPEITKEITPRTAGTTRESPPEPASQTKEVPSKPANSTIRNPVKPDDTKKNTTKPAKKEIPAKADGTEKDSKPTVPGRVPETKPPRRVKRQSPGKASPSPKPPKEPKRTLKRKGKIKVSNRYGDTLETKQREFGGGVQSQQYIEQQEFSHLLGSLTKQERLEMGHQPELMILDCSFNGLQCSHVNFTTILSRSFGNCYTFNTRPLRETPVKSFQSGSLYGLNLVLYIENHEHILGLVGSKGVRIDIHPFNTIAFPLETGLSIPPGFETNIGMRMLNISRQGGLYGACGEDEGMSWIYNKTYTVEGCVNTCLDRHVATDCKCYRTTHMDMYTDDQLATLQPCNTTREVKCIARITARLLEDDLCNCLPPCQDQQYELVMSSTVWPDGSYWPSLADAVCSTDDRACFYLQEQGMKDKNRALRDNFINLKIYYQDLNYEYLQQIPSYETAQFVSDIGGTVGLWLGASVLTGVEILDLLLRLILFCCRRRNN